MQLADRDGLARLGAACARARRAAHLRRGRDRLRPHRHAVRVGAGRPPPRPAVPRQGDDRGLPRDVGDGRERPRVPLVPRRRPRRAHAVPRPFLRRERARRPRSRCATSSCSTRGTCSRTCASDPTSCGSLLHDRVASKPAVREVRLEGLMGGVELAPPADGLRWGRRVSAAAVQAGRAAPARSATPWCSCRRSRSRRPRSTGSWTRSPTRSTTCATPETGRHAVTWDAWAARRGAPRSAQPGRWRAPRDLDAFGAGTAALAGEHRDGRVVRVERLPRAHLASRRDRRRARSARPLGHRRGFGAPDRRLAPDPQRARTRARRVEGHANAAALFPTGFAANLGVLTTFGDRRRARLLRRAQPRVDHRRLPARARRRRPCTATATSTTCRALLRDRGGRRALVVSDTVFSMDGDAADVDALVELCAQEHALLVLDEAHAVLGPNVDRRARRRRAARRHLLEDAGRARRIRRRAAPLRRADRELEPAVHLHDRADAGRHRGRARGAARAALGRRRRARRAAARATSTGCGPVIRRRSCRSSAARSSARSTRPRRCSRTASSCPRSGRRPSRPARRGCASR